MIVTRIGYLNFEDVLKLGQFSIYETKKKTHILVMNTSQNIISLYYPKKDRLPWKDVEGKKVTAGEKIFDSKVNDRNLISLKKWNNGNQIMAYKEFNFFEK
jgi:TRAP-type uncharacterized transport system substrate-binding protein